MSSADPQNSPWNQFLFKGLLAEIAMKIKEVAQDDPRRIIHSLKVALAITLVSLFFYLNPNIDGFGVNAIWAVLTVVVVFEFSVGATLGKGLNRIMGTFLAGNLGVGVHHLATLSSKTIEPILLGFFVFVIAAIATFMRFIPGMKAKHDYGLVVFILTFCLVSISGYPDDEILGIAHKRLSTIIIGCVAAIVTSICICPVWIGEDLENLVVGNMEKLGNFLEGFGDEFFKIMEDARIKNNTSLLEEYKSALTSKNNEETMANLARWEPRHGGFRFNHPWKQYLKVGTLTRQCAYKIEALNSYLTFEMQAPIEIRKRIHEICTKISSESGKAMKELASMIRKKTISSSVDQHIENSKNATKTLESLFKISLWDDVDILKITSDVAIALILIEVVTCVEEINEAVEELACLANFKDADALGRQEKPPLLHSGKVKPIVCSDETNHIITVDGFCPKLVELEKSVAPIVG